MATLQLRNGIWHLRYRDKRGRSCSLSTKLHTSPKNDILAQKKLVAFQVDLSRGKLPTQAVKIGTLLDNVIADYKINSKKSIVTMESHIEARLRPWFGDMRTDQFTAQDWRDYVVERQKIVKNATINRERAALRRGFSLAYESGTIQSIPFIPRLKDSPPRSGFVTRQEMESLCRHLPEHLKAFTRFAFLTGWRLSECRRLQWRHVSLEQGEIRIDPGSTKNGEGRVFPMTEELRGLLSALKSPTGTHIAAVGVMLSEKMPTLTHWVFHYQSRPIGWIYGAWHKAAKAIGKPGLMFHDLRRSAVREFIKQGMDQRVAMQLTGHRTTDVFLRYRIVAESDMERARKSMEAWANGGQDSKKA